MFDRILQKTGYDLHLTNDSQWLLDVLIGHGFSKKHARSVTGTVVTTFIAQAMRLRTRVLMLPEH